MELRKYQRDCLCAMRAGAGLVALPTSAGKTIIFATFCKEFQGSILILVQKNILVMQTVDKLYSIGVDEVAVYNAGENRKEIGKVTVASIQSLANYKGDLFFDAVIIDEVHRFSINKPMSITRRLLDDIKPSLVYGFTATPYEKKNFLYGNGKFFRETIYSLTLKELLEQGFLTELLTGGVRNESLNFDLTNVTIRGDDYNEEELQKACVSDLEKIKLQIGDALSRSDGRKSIIVMCTGILHSEIVYNILSQIEKCCIVHSQRTDRNRQLQYFVTGEVRICVSVLIPSEGFDHPPADCLWMMRPTRSPTLYVQAAGRVMRLFLDKQNSLFLDYGNIVDNMGLVYNVNKSIGKSKKEINKIKKEAPLKKCPACGIYNYCSTKFCQCGEQLIADVKLDKTTELAFENKPNIFNVTSFTRSPHTTKAGNQIEKIRFFGGLFDFIDYYVNSQYWTSKIFPDGYNVKQIYWIKDNSYKKILSVKY